MTVQKKIISIWCICFIFSLLSVSHTYASTIDAVESRSHVNIQVWYSADITPCTNDTFVLTYRILHTDVTATITLDAALLKTNNGLLAMDANAYQIVRIEYTGSNAAIKNNIYAITSEFTVSDTEYSEFILAIGQSRVDNLREQYDKVIIVDNTPLQEDPTDNETRAEITYETENEPLSETQTMIETLSTEFSDAATISSEPASSADSDELSTIETDFGQLSVLGIILRLIPPLIFIILLGLIIWYLWKNKIL